MDRREFLSAGAAFAAAGALSARGAAAAPKMRGVLLHLGQNMWGECLLPGEKRDPKMQYVYTSLQTDETTWRNLTALMQRRRYNFAVIDLGEGVVLPSHPELAVKGSWSADKMRGEIARLKAMGIEAIPKFNFSTCHDGWLGEYGRMIATRKYYEVVRDVINDACDIFGNPRYFHIGLDEEVQEESFTQRKYPLVIYRQGELWWHDFRFYLDCLEKRNAQPIAFSGAWGSKCLDTFDRRVPRDLINNVGWHKDVPNLDRLRERAKKNPVFAHRLRRIEFIKKLGEWKRPVLAEASNWTDETTLKRPYPGGKDFPRHPTAIVQSNDLVRSYVSDDCYLGSMCAPWEHIKPPIEDYWASGINQMADYMDAKGL